MEFMDGTWEKEINTWEELVGNNLPNQEAVIEGAVHSIRNIDVYKRQTKYRCLSYTDCYCAMYSYITIYDSDNPWNGYCCFYTVWYLSLIHILNLISSLQRYQDVFLESPCCRK